MRTDSRRRRTSAVAMSSSHVSQGLGWQLAAVGLGRRLGVARRGRRRGSRREGTRARVFCAAGGMASLVDVVSHSGLAVKILGGEGLRPRDVVHVQASCRPLSRVLWSLEGDAVWRALYEARWGKHPGGTPPRPHVHGTASTGFYKFVRSWREAYCERQRGVLEMSAEAAAHAAKEVVDTPRARLSWSQESGPRSYCSNSTGQGIARACRGVDRWGAAGHLPVCDVVHGLLAPSRPWVANIVGIQQILKRHGARAALFAVEDGLRGKEPPALAATGEVLSVRWWTIGPLPHTRHQGGFRARDAHHQVSAPLMNLLRAAVRAEDLAEERPGISPAAACEYATSECGVVATSGADFLDMWRVLERGARHEVRRIEVAVGSVTDSDPVGGSFVI